MKKVLLMIIDSLTGHQREWTTNIAFRPPKGRPHMVILVETRMLCVSEMSDGTLYDEWNKRPMLGKYEDYVTAWRAMTRKERKTLKAIKVTP